MTPIEHYSFFSGNRYRGKNIDKLTKAAQEGSYIPERGRYHLWISLNQIEQLAAKVPVGGEIMWIKPEARGKACKIAYCIDTANGDIFRSVNLWHISQLEIVPRTAEHTAKVERQIARKILKIRKKRLVAFS